MSTMQVSQNLMCKLKIAKVVVNIGVGKSGEPLEKAKSVLQELFGQTPSLRKAKQAIRDFGIHRGEPIGVMVTLRREKSLEALKRLLKAKDMRLPSSSFDSRGNCSFGIREHIEIPGVKYRPEVGLFGMSVSVALVRPGYRVMWRRRAKSKIGHSHRINKEEAMEFFKTEFNMEMS